MTGDGLLHLIAGEFAQTNVSDDIKQTYPTETIIVSKTSG